MDDLRKMQALQYEIKETVNTLRRENGALNNYVKEMQKQNSQLARLLSESIKTIEELKEMVKSVNPAERSREESRLPKTARERQMDMENSL